MHVSKLNLTLQYNLMGPAHFCFNIEAAHSPLQRIISEAVSVLPSPNLHRYVDGKSGNRFLRFDAGPGLLDVNYQANVELQPQAAAEGLGEVPVSDVPDDVLRYMMPSRYCESDVMSRSAQQIFGRMAPGYDRVKAVAEWTRDTIAYLPGSTTSTTTAQEVFVLRAGVCRDYAHLAITMCRALNIPARLVVGYVNFDEPPQDFHAIFEAWLGGRWVLFDPSGMAPVDRVVRIGTGRDAKDVAFATIFGPAQMTAKQVWVDESDNGVTGATVVIPAPATPIGPAISAPSSGPAHTEQVAIATA